MAQSKGDPYQEGHVADVRGLGQEGKGLSDRHLGLGLLLLGLLGDNARNDKPLHQEVCSGHDETTDDDKGHHTPQGICPAIHARGKMGTDLKSCKGKHFININNPSETKTGSKIDAQQAGQFETRACITKAAGTCNRLHSPKAATHIREVLDSLAREDEGNVGTQSEERIEDLGFIDSDNLQANNVSC